MKLTKEQMEEIKALLSKNEDVGTPFSLRDELDEMVHDAFSKQASDVNNQGEDAQLKFLAEGFDDFKYFKAYIVG
jgi:hypothetical protein